MGRHVQLPGTVSALTRRDVLANIGSAATYTGTFFIATDVNGGQTYWSDGTAWNAVGGPINPSGKVLAEVASTGSFNITQDSTFHDVTSISNLVIPAGVAFNLEFDGQWQTNQGTAAQFSGPLLQIRVVDVATSTVNYLFDYAKVIFPTTTGGQMVLPIHTGMASHAALSVDTPVKLQAAMTSISGLGGQVLDVGFSNKPFTVRARAT